MTPEWTALFSQRAKEIRKGKLAIGKKELIKHYQGKRLTQREMIYANCYACCGFYEDGRVDCENLECVFHSLMPYRESKDVDKIDSGSLARGLEGTREGDAPDPVEFYGEGVGVPEPPEKRGPGVPG